MNDQPAAEQTSAPIDILRAGAKALREEQSAAYERTLWLSEQHRQAAEQYASLGRQIDQTTNAIMALMAAAPDVFSGEGDA